jgi:hypothetical protein
VGCAHSAPRRVYDSTHHARSAPSQLFERIISDPEIAARYTPNVVSTEPWIVVFENFATREHWKFLETELADQFEGSTVVGGMDAYGNIERQTLKTRTSNNAWCNLDSCSKSNEIRDLQDRLLGILGPTVGRHHLEVSAPLRPWRGCALPRYYDAATVGVGPVSAIVDSQMYSFALSTPVLCM